MPKVTIGVLDLVFLFCSVLFSSLGVGRLVAPPVGWGGVACARPSPCRSGPPWAPPPPSALLPVGPLSGSRLWGVVFPPPLGVNAGIGFS